MRCTCFPLVNLVKFKITEAESISKQLKNKGKMAGDVYLPFFIASHYCIIN